MVVAAWWVLAAGCASMSSRYLYYPTHHGRTNGLQEWRDNGDLFGYCRWVENPETIWLFVHGNGGQAADRVYALHAFSPRDAVFIVEYPGYGQRPGVPSKDSFDEAVRRAYDSLRRSYPGKPVCVAAESIGSGPAALLAREPVPPDKFVFVVPFDVLRKVASEYLGLPFAGWLLGRSWNNIEALRQYQGPVDVFGARDDQVIPLRRARALATSLPQARFVVVAGGHNDWPQQQEIQFRRNH